MALLTMATVGVTKMNAVVPETLFDPNLALGRSAASGQIMSSFLPCAYQRGCQVNLPGNYLRMSGRKGKEKAGMSCGEMAMERLATEKMLAIIPLLLTLAMPMDNQVSANQLAVWESHLS